MSTPKARAYQAQWKRAWRAKNAVAYNAYMQNRRDANRQVIQARDRAYYAKDYAAHPERHLTKSKKRRALKLGASRSDLTHAQWLAIQEAQGHRCAYCGKRAKGQLTQDHITPLSKGGSHTLHNVVAACRSCNARKNAGSPPKPVQPLLL